MEIPQNYINELTYKITGDCIEVDQIVGPRLFEKCVSQGNRFQSKVRLFA